MKMHPGQIIASNFKLRTVAWAQIRGAQPAGLHMCFKICVARACVNENEDTS